MMMAMTENIHTPAKEGIRNSLVRCKRIKFVIRVSRGMGVLIVKPFYGGGMPIL